MEYKQEDKEKYMDSIGTLEALCFEKGDVNSLYIKALSIVKEVVKWDGDPRPIFEHGYVHEKGRAINRLLDEKNIVG